ncbi:MAG: DUF2079 domain-containing protein, partial [Patescibacteria group bacterium]
ARVVRDDEAVGSSPTSPTMSKLVKFISDNKAFVAISAVFFVIYSLLSLVNHYNFRTSTLDLGIYNRAIFRYAHFQSATDDIIYSSLNRQGDHFEITMILSAPLYYIFGSYSLLVFQILMAMFGATGIYVYLNEKTSDRWLSMGGAVIFYSFYGLFAGILFDYHNNLTGIMFLPWILLAIAKNSKKYYYLLLALMILSKEPFALLAVFLGAYVALFENKEWRKHGLITVLIGALSFKFILSVIIPYFSNYQPYGHWVYGQIGEGPMDAIKNLTLHPLNALKIIFNNQIKLNSLALLGVSGGIIAIFNPLAAILFAPLLATKYFSSAVNHWTYYFQYNVEFGPIMAISLVLVLKKLPKKLQYIILSLFIILNLLISFTAPFNDWKRVTDIFTYNFYFDSRANDMRTAIKQIPANASVSAENNFVPHLINREKIYLFPRGIAESEYVILNVHPAYSQIINELKSYGGFQLFYKINNVEIYKKETAEVR